MVDFFFGGAQLYAQFFQQTTTCTMIPSLIMHLYDYQSFLLTILPMCLDCGDVLTFVVCGADQAIVQS